MKRITIEQRLKGSFALLILFLFAAVALTWIACSVQNRAVQRETGLRAQADRITRDLLQMDSEIEATLLAPDPESGARALKDPVSDLSAAVNQIEYDFRESDELSRAVEAIQSFATSGVAPNSVARLQAETRARTDEATAVDYYRAHWQAVHSEQGRLLRDFEGIIATLIRTDNDTASTISLLCFSVVIILMLASLLVAFRPTAAVMEPLSRLSESLRRMSQGDFTQRAGEDTDEFGQLGAGLNHVTDEVTALVGQVHRSGIQVNTTATEIAATARQQQSTANEIAATTAEIGATSRQISATSKELDKTMNEVSRGSQETAQLADNGQASITRMEGTMRQIMDASGVITAKLAVLSEKTANVNTVVTTIAKVADQTNLLSLNAAIEAEKAGEYGLGFAVVAAEIRRLADQTAVATYDIEKMVKEMQSAVASGVMGMEKFSEEVRRGVEEVRQVGSQLARIIHQVQALMPRFQSVHEGMHAQATGAQQISETLSQLNEAAHQTADSLRHSNLAIDRLNEAARGLQSSVGRFRIKT